MSVPIKTIINYYELPGGLVSSGQPSAEELAAIRDAGYKVIINLVPPDASMALANEEEIVTALGMAHVHIPIIWDTPRHADAARFFEAMQSHRDRRIYVHCEVNYRASSLLYLYRRKYLGVEGKKARQDLVWIWEPNATWKRFIDEVMALP